MCDTFISIQPSQGGFIFGKNSDRESDEGQSVVFFPRIKCVDVRLRCTYINIPQARETFAVWLSKPLGIWGAEMGVNEFGLTIGNEAVFTKIPFAKNNDGLSGMDLVRLALERCKSASAAIHLITYLLKTYGQDACGGFHNRNFYYHNSFLIADRNEAYILETADRAWAVKKVTGKASISNGLTITDDYDFISTNTSEIALANKLKVKEGSTVNFRMLFSDRLYTFFSRCNLRQQATLKGISDQNFALHSAMETLRSHHQPLGKFHPKRGRASDVCMHATGLLNPSSTTGSMVVDTMQEKIIVWFTATAYPCISLYIPFFFSATKNDQLASILEAKPSNSESIWYLHQEFYNLLKTRNRKQDWPGAQFRSELDHLQQQIMEEMQSPKNHHLEYTASVLKLYNNKLKEWISNLIKSV